MRNKPPSYACLRQNFPLLDHDTIFFLSLLFIGYSTFAQTDTTFGKPIFWYRVSDSWAMFMGSEGPPFILDPSHAKLINLEFGLNLQVELSASSILDQVLCFKYLEPMRPYANKPNYFFIEFAQRDYYFKMYDKGKQYRNILKNVPNTLRIEVKAMNSRFLNRLGIQTLEDLLDRRSLEALGRKFDKIIQGIVFDDDTIDVSILSSGDRKLYGLLSNPKKWRAFKFSSTSTTRNQKNRFKRIVEEYGERKIYSHVLAAAKTKIFQLRT